MLHAAAREEGRRVAAAEGLTRSPGGYMHPKAAWLRARTQSGGATLLLLLLFFLRLFLRCEAPAIARPWRRVTPRAEQNMMDVRVARVGFTALFTGRVSGFPGCSDTLQLLDGVAGSGSCIHQPD